MQHEKPCHEKAIRKCISGSRSVWPDGQIILQYLAICKQLTFAQWHDKVATIGSKFCQIVNKPSNIAKDF